MNRRKKENRKYKIKQNKQGNNSQCRKHGLGPDQNAQLMTAESLKIIKLKIFLNIFT